MASTHRESLKHLWTRYLRNRTALAGLLLTIFFIILALFGPSISPFDPLKVAQGEPLTPPSAIHLMGTDDLGRDTFSGFLSGARVSLLVGFVAAAFSTVIGVLVGAVSGYYGGLVDELLMRTTETAMIIPRFFLAMLVVAVLGASVWNVIWVLGILSWPMTARLLRAEFLSLKEREFVEAMRVFGAPDRVIIFSEILPNATAPIIVSASLQVATAILLEASLSFFGLSDPTVMSWGRMVFNSMPFISSAWWMSVFPGAAIFISVLGLNLVGDWLSDALNPRTRQIVGIR